MEPRKHYFAKIPTIAIFIVMAMSGPLGSAAAHPEGH